MHVGEGCYSGSEEGRIYSVRSSVVGCDTLTCSFFDFGSTHTFGYD